MKNIFSKDIFKLALKKLVLVSTLTLMLSITITYMLISSRYSGGYTGIFRLGFYYTLTGSNGHTAAGIAPILIFVMFICSALFTFIIFNYQNKRASSDKYHSLPYTNIQQFVSRLLAILVMLYSIIILTMLTAWITLSATDSVYTFRYIILGTLGYIAGSTLIVGVVATAMSFTGNVFGNITVSAVLLFLPRCILFMIGMLITKASFQLVNLNELNVFLNPSINIPTGILLDASNLWQYNGTSETIINPKGIIYTLVIGLIYIAVALFVNNRRKSELAGKSFINDWISYIFAGLCTMPMILFSGYVIANNYLDNNSIISSISKSSIALVVFAIVIFIVISIIYNGKFKDIIKNSIVFVITCTISFLFMSGGYLIADNQLHKSISSNEVKCLTINLSTDKAYINTPTYPFGVLVAKDIKIHDKELIELLTASLDKAIDNIDDIPDSEYALYSSTKFWCEFYMDNGQKIVRNIPVYQQTEAAKILNLLLDDTDYYNALSSMPEDSLIKECYMNGIPENHDTYAYDVWDSLIYETSKNNNEGRRLLPIYLQSSVFNNYESIGQVGNLFVKGEYNNNAYISVYEIDNSVPETKKLYMKNISSYNYETLTNALEIILENNSENIDISITIDLGTDYPYSFYTNNPYYTSYGEALTLSTEQFIQLCSDLKKMDTEGFDVYTHYAAVNLNLYSESGNVTMYLDTFVPLSDEIFNYWSKIVLNN